MAQQKLYSGTNSNEEIYVGVDGHKVVYLMRHWTTHPGEAMDFAHVSARRHGGEMVVLFVQYPAPGGDWVNFSSHSVAEY